MSNPRGVEALIFLIAATVSEGASMFVLWYFTAEWSDYLFILLFCLAGVLVLFSGAAWVQGDFAKTKSPGDEEGHRRLCGDTKRHPSHTFMRMEVLFQCPGEHGTEDAR